MDESESLGGLKSCGYLQSQCAVPPESNALDAELNAYCIASQNYIVCESCLRFMTSRDARPKTQCCCFTTSQNTGT